MSSGTPPPIPTSAVVAKPLPPKAPTPAPASAPNAKPGGLRGRARILAPGSGEAASRARSVTVGEWLFRLTGSALMAGAIALLVWIFFLKLTPLQKQSRDLGVQVARLSSEVDEMERNWDEKEIEQLTGDFSRINSHLFADEAALASWLGNLQEQVVPLALDASAEFGTAILLDSTNHQNLALIPATISVSVASNVPAIQSPYQRLLRLSHELTSRERRVDLMELNVNGGASSVSIQQATLVLNLWAGKERTE
jgi:hypothetical protein